MKEDADDCEIQSKLLYAKIKYFSQEIKEDVYYFEKNY